MKYLCLLIIIYFYVACSITSEETSGSISGIIIVGDEKIATMKVVVAEGESNALLPDSMYLYKNGNTLEYIRAVVIAENGRFTFNNLEMGDYELMCNNYLYGGTADSISVVSNSPRVDIGELPLYRVTTKELDLNNYDFTTAYYYHFSLNVTASGSYEFPYIEFPDSTGGVQVLTLMTSDETLIEIEVTANGYVLLVDSSTTNISSGTISSSSMVSSLSDPMSSSLDTLYLEHTFEECTDGLDNDNDGLIDCNDPNCHLHNICFYMERTGIQCTDGIDNDYDQLIDCDDPECNTFCKEDPENTLEECTDGIDNDNNGRTDCYDHFCSLQDFCSGTENTIERCTDGIDNDNDGTIDCNDIECLVYNICGMEGSPITCSDGLDNDYDQLIDCDDPDCNTFCVEDIENTSDLCMDGSNTSTTDTEEIIVYDCSNTILKSNYINDIEVDSKGVMWISNHGHGLFRFDGTDWTMFSTSNSDLPSNYINDLFVDNNDVLYIATTNGLITYDGTQFINHFTTANSPFERNNIKNIVVDNSGDIWLSNGHFSEGGLYRYNGSEWVLYSPDNSPLESRLITSLYIVDSRLYVSSEYGFFVLDNDIWTVYTKENIDLPYNYISLITASSNGTIWIGTSSMYDPDADRPDFNDAVYSFESGTLQIQSPEFTSDVPRSVTAFGHGSLDQIWMATSNVYYFGSGISDYPSALSIYDGTSWDIISDKYEILQKNVIQGIVKVHNGMALASAKGLIIIKE